MTMGNIHSGTSFLLETSDSRPASECYVNHAQCDASELTISRASTSVSASSQANSTSAVQSNQSMFEKLLQEVRLLKTDIDCIKVLLNKNEALESRIQQLESR